jgi:predicted nucleic acid-binding protein
MIAVDTNILVYAHRIDAPLHQEAKACISSLRASHDALGTALARRT